MRHTLFLVLSLAIGCESVTEPTEVTPSPELVGDWSTDDYLGVDATLILADGTYNAEWDDTLAGSEVSGTYTDDGGMVELSDSGGPYVCPDDQQPGIYTYVLTETTLVFTETDDPCEAREAFITSPWTR